MKIIGFREFELFDDDAVMFGSAFIRSQFKKYPMHASYKRNKSITLK